MYKVYVVDDDPVILEEIVSKVSWLDNGFCVSGCSVSVTEAIKDIKSLCPHVVFCDLKMPVMDGVEMMKALKAEGIFCEFVMLSAFDSFQDSRRFFRLEGFDYLLKPIDLDEVQIVLEGLSSKLSSSVFFEAQYFLAPQKKH